MEPFIYLGVQGYGCAHAEEKDRFVHRFWQRGRVHCFTVSNSGRCAAQNTLQEGKVYTLTVRQQTVTAAILCPADACGMIHAVSGSMVTVGNSHLVCRAVFEIRTRAGGAAVCSCFLTSRIVGSYAEVYGDTVFLRPEPQMYRPPVCGIPGQCTLKNLLQTALMPVGTALYVYGGGWNWQDTASGNTAMHIGLPQSWNDFFEGQDACYTYRNNADPARSYYPTGGWNQYGYAGLDCSGYLGWIIYNVMHTENATVSTCDGYVTRAADFAPSLAARGWGELHRGDRGDGAQEPSALHSGDIFSMDGHVWLCVGTCHDGSVLIAHSTPSPSRIGCKGGGVQLSALIFDENSSTGSDALRLAEQYMQRFCPHWSARYAVQAYPYAAYARLPEKSGGLFRWNDEILPDQEGWRDKSAEQVLKIEN